MIVEVLRFDAGVEDDSADDGSLDANGDGLAGNVEAVLAPKRPPAGGALKGAFGSFD